MLSVVIVVLVLWPAYRDPSSRMYTSGFGYGSVKRKMGGSFEVETALAKSEVVSIPYLGEGVITAEPLRVPVIPMATIAS